MSFRCRRVSKTYFSRAGPVAALRDVSFSVSEGEFVCIVGASGCGKTTLLKVLAGLLAPTSGTVVWGPVPPGAEPSSALVFQEHGLFPWMRVLENVAFGLEMLGVSRDERKRRAMEFIEAMGLAGFARNYPHELSVGMRQRAGIARAFVTDSDLLLMDEPFGSLDAQSKLVCQEELLRIWKDHRKTVVYVTRDIREAVLLGDRVLVMSGRPGSICEDVAVDLGRPRDLSYRTEARVAELIEHVWRVLEDEVRLSLGEGP